MAIEIADFPINSMVIFHCYVSTPEGITRGIIENIYVDIQLVWLEFFVIWQGYCVWFFGQPWGIKWWTKNEDRFPRAMLDNQKMWHWLNVIDPQSDRLFQIGLEFTCIFWERNIGNIGVSRRSLAALLVSLSESHHADLPSGYLT